MGRHDGLITYARWQIKKLHLHTCTCYKEVKVVPYVVVIDPKFEYMFMFLALFENYPSNDYFQIGQRGNTNDY